jgi:hypothetical protein
LRRKISALLLALGLLAVTVTPVSAEETAYIMVEVVYVVDCSSALKFDYPENLDEPALIKLGEEVYKIDELYRAERTAELEKALSGILTVGGGPFKLSDSRGKNLSLSISADSAQSRIQNTTVILAVPYADTPENADIKFTLTAAPIPDGYALTAYLDRPGRNKTERAVQVTLIPEAGFPPVDYSAIAVPGAEPPKTAELVAKPTAASVLVNGETVAFDAYSINGNNYFKLRDLAYVLSGSEKQFEVGWDSATNAITLTSGMPYTAVGGEMSGRGSGEKTPIPTDSKIYLDGREVDLTAYNIGGNNYFKLRDIGQKLDFGVTWDGVNSIILIDTAKAYSPE